MSRQFQSHQGQCIQFCLRCGAKRKLNGILDRAAPIAAFADVRGHWETFRGLTECVHHNWSG